MNFRKQLQEMAVERTDDQLKDTYKDNQEVDIETVFTTLPDDEVEIFRGSKIRNLSKRYRQWREKNKTK